MSAEGGGNNDGSTSNPVGVAIGVTVALGAAAFYTYRLRRQSSHQYHMVPLCRKDLEGMTVCLTGGNIGIGRAVAIQLGQRGARVLIGCRNMQQGKQVCDLIHKTSGGRNPNQCQVFPLDLALPSSIDSFCQSIQNQTTRSGGLHLLINNAGAMIKEEHRLVREDEGDDDYYDRSMAVNHLGWVQLTQNLIPLMEQTKTDLSSATTTTISPNAVRIVNVGSKLEKTAKLPTNTNNTEDATVWDEWMKTSPLPYTPFQAYAKAKFAMTATTMEWTSQTTTTSSKNIPILLVSPGMVNTSLPRFMPLWQRILSWPFRSLLLRTPEQAADTVLWVSTSPEALQPAAGAEGRYHYYYNATCQPIYDDPNQCSDAVRNPTIRNQIWLATKRAIEKRRKQPPPPQQEQQPQGN